MRNKRQKSFLTSNLWASRRNQRQKIPKALIALKLGGAHKVRWDRWIGCKK